MKNSRQYWLAIEYSLGRQKAVGNMAARFPTLATPDTFLHVRTNVYLLDALPLVSLLSCLPSTVLFFKRRRHADLVSRLYSAKEPVGVFAAKLTHVRLQVLCTLGLAFASAYHCCFLASDFGASPGVLGVSGEEWRTCDVILAQVKAFIYVRVLRHLNLNNLSLW